MYNANIRRFFHVHDNLGPVDFCVPGVDLKKKVEEIFNNTSPPFLIINDPFDHCWFENCAEFFQKPLRVCSSKCCMCGTKTQKDAPTF